MLYEAFYPAEKLQNKPSKIFYGFVEESPLVKLVIFDAQATTTSILSLSPENKEKLAYRLLKNHIYGVQADLIKVVFLRSQLINGEFSGESWSIEIKKHYVEEETQRIAEKNKAKLGLFGRFFYKIFKIPMFITVSVAKKNVTIGVAENISLYDYLRLDQEQVERLLITLKKTDYGDFNAIFYKA